DSSSTMRSAGASTSSSRATSRSSPSATGLSTSPSTRCTSCATRGSAVPEQPEPSATALGEIARDAADRGTPADAGTVDFAAVTSGPEAGGKRRRALRVGTWLSLAWMAFVVGGAILAPYLPLDDPQNSITQIARRGPFAKAGN